MDLDEVRAEIVGGEKALSALVPRGLRLWERIRIDPVRWAQGQYEGEGPVWVVAILGRQCMYWNNVESGWGWGTYEDWGSVTGYHWQSDDIQHAVAMALSAIDDDRLT